jgi:hypothetical protein
MQKHSKLLAARGPPKRTRYCPSGRVAQTRRRGFCHILRGCKSEGEACRGRSQPSHLIDAIGQGAVVDCSRTSVGHLRQKA